MRKYILIGIAVGVLLSSVVVVLAGNLDSPGTPANTNWYSLDDIWNRLNDGTAGTQGAFEEPAAGPGGTMHTLNEIYDLIGLRAPVPKTGQTTKYADGDDGDLEKGVAWPAPRFTDNGDGTVTDNLTGLIWLKNANCAGGIENWATALAYSNELYDGCDNCFGTADDCGLSDGSAAGDWRLPNVRELYSLIDLSQYNPALPSGHPFSAVQSNDYWSSTPVAFDTDAAWLVHLDGGGVDGGLKTNSRYVWPVRGGQ